MSTQYDFSPLSAVVNSEERKIFENEFPDSAKHQKLSGYTVLVSTLFISVLLYFFISGFMASARSPVPAVVLTVIIGVILLTVVGMRSKAKGTQLIRLSKFATKNNMKLRLDSRDIGAYAGLLFDEGHSRVFRETLETKEGYEIGTYEYVVGSGKNRRTYNYGYAKIKLYRNVPNILLDSRRNNTLFGSNLPDVYAKSQKLSLEGDFNNYFTLYAPDSYKTDALYIFTPDVMAALIDHGDGYDVELVDDHMYLYKKSEPFSTESSLREWIEVIKVLQAQVGKQAKSYRDDKVVASPATSDMPNEVAVGGKRLKRGVNVGLVVIVVGFFVLQIISTFEGPARTIASSLVSIGVLVLIVMWVRSKFKN